MNGRAVLRRIRESWSILGRLMGRGKPYSPKPGQTSAVLGDVFYEMWQFYHALGKSTGDRVLENALLESRLVHFRNLFDFFDKPQARMNDVLATHFGRRFSMVGVDAGMCRRINKQLAHLTYTRTGLTEAQREWPRSKFLPLLVPCREFIDHILARDFGLTTEQEAGWLKLRRDLEDSSVPKD